MKIDLKQNLVLETAGEDYETIYVPVERKTEPLINAILEASKQLEGDLAFRIFVIDAGKKDKLICMPLSDFYNQVKSWVEMFWEAEDQILLRQFGMRKGEYSRQYTFVPKKPKFWKDYDKYVEHIETLKFEKKAPRFWETPQELKEFLKYKAKNLKKKKRIQQVKMEDK